jgi:hypothetical protein
MLGATKVKTLRQMCAATILSLMFAVSTLAGDTHCPGAVSTPTNTTTATTTIILVAVNVIY